MAPSSLDTEMAIGDINSDHSQMSVLDVSMEAPSNSLKMDASLANLSELPQASSSDQNFREMDVRSGSSKPRDPPAELSSGASAKPMQEPTGGFANRQAKENQRSPMFENFNEAPKK